MHATTHGAWRLAAAIAVTLDTTDAVPLRATGIGFYRRNLCVIWDWIVLALWRSVQRIGPVQMTSSSAPRHSSWRSVGVVQSLTSSRDGATVHAGWTDKTQRR